MHVYRHAFDNEGAPIATWEDFCSQVATALATGPAEMVVRGETIRDKRTLPAFAPHIAPHGRGKAASNPVCDLAYLDLDDLPDLSFSAKLEGVAHLIHTTPSDTGTAPRKVRVYARVDRPILPDECGRFRKALAQVLGVVCDPSTLDAKRIGFAGRMPGSSEREVWGTTEGEPLPVDALLALIPAEPERAPQASSAELDVDPAWLEPTAQWLAQHWDLGHRNALAMGLGGWLALRGIPREQCAQLVEMMPSTDPQARVSDAMRSYDTADSGEPVAGWSLIAQHLSGDAAAGLEQRVPSPHTDALAQVQWGKAAEQRAPKAPERTPEVAAALGETTDPQVDLAIAQLAVAGVYQRAGSLVEVLRAPVEHEGEVRAVGRPIIGALQPARCVELLRVRVGPWAADFSATIRARGQWNHIPPLEGIASYPVLRPDGTVLCVSGYDPQTKTYAHIDLVPEIGETHTDACEALEAFRDLLCDFPLSGEPDFAAWLCGLLTPLAKPAIDGACPLTLLDASTRGAGKTLLADVIGAVVTGRPLPRLSSPQNEEEMGKLLFATLREGAAIAFFDNVTTMLRSADLDKILTGTEYEGRVLGESRRETLPVRTTFIASMNNVSLSTDLVRRSVQCRLEPAQENPEARDASAFRYPDLLAHVHAHRERYLGAALTILRAYAFAGRPQVQGRSAGSYTSWSRVVRDAILWAGGADPIVTQDRLRADADVERDDTGNLLRTWHELIKDEWVSTRGLLEHAQLATGSVAAGAHLPGVLALADAIEGVLPQGIKPSSKALGNRMRKMRKLRVDGMILEDRLDTITNAKLWRVRKIADEKQG